MERNKNIKIDPGLTIIMTMKARDPITIGGEYPVTLFYFAVKDEKNFKAVLTHNTGDQYKLNNDRKYDAVFMTHPENFGKLTQKAYNADMKEHDMFYLACTYLIIPMDLTVYRSEGYVRLNEGELITLIKASVDTIIKHIIKLNKENKSYDLQTNGYVDEFAESRIVKEDGKVNGFLDIKNYSYVMYLLWKYPVRHGGSTYHKYIKYKNKYLKLKYGRQ